MSEPTSHRIQTAIGRVRGLGSARSGTYHFWHMRVTSVALLLLSAAFVVIVVSLLGRNQSAVAQILGSPGIAMLMLLFIGAGIYHMWLGMQEIIIDYVHQDTLKLFTLMLNTFFCFTVGVVCVFAILKLSFGL